jgi:hypothetical protein
MWYFGLSPEAKTEYGSPSGVASPHAQLEEHPGPSGLGTAEAVTPQLQESTPLAGAPATPDTFGARLTASGRFEKVSFEASSTPPGWLQAYTDHLEEEAAAAAVVSEATTTVPAKDGTYAGKAISPKTREASRAGRRTMLLTPLNMARKAGGMFAFNVGASPVGNYQTPPFVLADSTNRPDNVTPPVAAGRPRLQKRVQKVKKSSQLDKLGIFDKENIAPNARGPMAVRAAMNSHHMMYTPGHAVV